VDGPVSAKKPRRVKERQRGERQKDEKSSKERDKDGLGNEKAEVVDGNGDGDDE
jgi:hypothetical protein